MNKQHPLYEQLSKGWLSPANIRWMEANTEEWRPVVGYEGWYEVSSFGKVRRSRPGKATFAGRILKPSLRRNSRKTVYLRVEGADKQREVSHLVAEAFIGPRPEGQEINHIDGNPGNNCYYNLEYCTRSENALHAFSLGLWKAKRGEEVPWSKLTNEQVIVIRSCKGIVPQRILAKAFNVSVAPIKTIWNYQTWKHI